MDHIIDTITSTFVNRSISENCTIVPVSYLTG